jgi:GNAT superfamily N-acetyltransferase
VRHRLAELFADAARGRFPPADGTVEVVGSPPGRSDAVVAFTGYNVVACSAARERVLALLEGDDPVAAPMRAGFLHRLGELIGAEPGMVDVVLVAPAAARSAPPPLARADAAENARVTRALRYRDDLAVYRSDGGVLTLGRGLAGRLEVSIGVEPSARVRGVGRALAEAAVALAPPGEPVFAQVSPGNAASLRAFLAAGYRPIGSEVLYLSRAQAQIGSA